MARKGRLDWYYKPWITQKPDIVFAPPPEKKWNAVPCPYCGGDGECLREGVAPEDADLSDIVSCADCGGSGSLEFAPVPDEEDVPDEAIDPLTHCH